MDKNLIKVIALGVGLVAIIALIVYIALQGLNLGFINAISVADISAQKGDIELAKQDELKNKRLITDMWVLTTTAFVFYIALIIISSILLGEGSVLAAIVCISTAILLIVCFYGFKLEVDAGYFECRHCHHVFEEKNYFKLLMAPHMGTSRYQKCPKCGKRTFAKKVMTKED